MGTGTSFRKSLSYFAQGTYFCVTYHKVINVDSQMMVTLKGCKDTKKHEQAGIWKTITSPYSS